MILTGTQLSSTTEKALCQKTTSTCGHTRKYIHTHTHERACTHMHGHIFSSSVKQMITFHTSSTGLSKQLISECAQLRGFSALLWTSALRYKAAYPKGHTHSLPYVITHDTKVCVCVYSEAAGTPRISIWWSYTSWVLPFSNVTHTKVVTRLVNKHWCTVQVGVAELSLCTCEKGILTLWP